MEKIKEALSPLADATYYLEVCSQPVHIWQKYLTLIIQGDSYPTLPFLILIVQCLKIGIEEKKNDELQSGYYSERFITFCTNLLTKLGIYFDDRLDKVTIVSCLLNPFSLKSLRINDEVVEEAWRFIASEMERLTPGDGAHLSQTVEEIVAPRSLFHYVTPRKKRNQGSIEEELEEYKVCCTLFKNKHHCLTSHKQKEANKLVFSETGIVNPLSWWRENSQSYPRLSKVARDYLTIPASSASSERVFSSSGKILSDLRTSLKADTLAGLTFMYTNKKLLQ